jgi:hypothetical protein
LEVFMKGKSVSWAVRVIGVLTLAGVTVVLAGTRAPNHFIGVINDYTAWPPVADPWKFAARGR